MALLRRASLLLAIVTASTNLVPDSLYFGRYKCGNYAHLMLHIERVDEEGIDAIFHFLYPSSTQHGAYFMRGSYEFGGRVIKLEPVDWLLKPIGKVVMVGLMGVISADNDTFAGEVMHGSCGKFEVNRTAPLTDIAPPESTIYFPSPGGGLPTKQMVLRAEGPIMMEFGKMPREDDSGGSTPRREALQMFLNGVDGLVHEARQQRRARKENIRKGTTTTISAKAAMATPLVPPTLPPGSPGRPARPYQPVTPEHAASMNEAEVAAQLHLRVENEHFEEAYSLFSRVTIEERQRVGARLLLSGPTHGKGIDYSQGTRFAQTLAVIGGRLPAAGRTLATMLQTAEDDDSAKFLEGQMKLMLERSGSEAADQQLKAFDALMASLTEKMEIEMKMGDAVDYALMLNGLIDGQPQWSLPLRRRAAIWLQRGRHERAEKDLRMAVERAPHDCFAWAELGGVLKEKGDTKGALEAYKEAKARHPRMAELRRLKQWMTVAEGM